VLSVNTIIFERSVGSSPNLTQKCLCRYPETVLIWEKSIDSPENQEKQVFFLTTLQKVGQNNHILTKFSAICIQLYN
jgi:hypothetical protein